MKKELAARNLANKAVLLKNNPTFKIKMKEMMILAIMTPALFGLFI